VRIRGSARIIRNVRSSERHGRRSGAAGDVEDSRARLHAWGGWTTAGTSRTRTSEAVLASEAAICVAQFMKQPNPDEKLKALGEVNSWQRAEPIEKGGWDRMPGQEKAGYAVARACADGLELLMKK
jgi:hypothetical protein